MADPFKDHQPGLDSNTGNLCEITPSDVVDSCTSINWVEATQPPFTAVAASSTSNGRIEQQSIPCICLSLQKLSLFQSSKDNKSLRAPQTTASYWCS